MAKKKDKDKPKKKLKDLSKKDLVTRKAGKDTKIQNLKEQKKEADTPKEKKNIQKKIDKVEKRSEKISNVLDKKVYEAPDEQTLLDKIYNSDGFKMLSPANQQLIRTAVDSFTPEQLQNFKLSPKRLNLISQEAKQAVQDEYNYTTQQFDQDAEQTLRNDTAFLQRSLEEAESNPQKTDDDIIAIRNLKDALAEATKQYQEAADFKNTYLQNQLADIDKKLNTDISRANEDEIIKLRQYQRQYQTDLRGVQDNMAQRGLAISGIRMREETTTTDNYNDLTTTAQQEAQRIREDAETLADQSKRDLQLSTSFDLQDLLNQYSGQQKEAIQGAEGVLGTEKVSGILPEYTGVGDADLTSYQYGGVKGSYNTAYDTQKNDNFAAYEAKYGTSALINRFRGQLGTYKPVGGIIGTENVAKQRAYKTAGETKKINKKAIVQQGTKNYLQAKGLL